MYNNATQRGEEWLDWTRIMELKYVNLNLGFDTEWGGDGNKTENEQKRGEISTQMFLKINWAIVY